MFGIAKKGLMVAGAGALVVGGILGAGPAWSYVRTALGMARRTVQDAVPFAVELERLETMVGSLDRVIEENERKLIVQEVRLERLEAENVRIGQNLAREEAALRRLRDLLGAGVYPIACDGRVWSEEDLRAEGTRRVTAYRGAQEVLAMRTATAGTLQEAIGISRRQLDEARSAREERTQQLAALRADRVKLEAKRELAATVRAASFADPGNRFDEVNRLFDRLRERLDVESRLVDRDIAAAPAGTAAPAFEETRLETLLDDVLPDAAPVVPAPSTPVAAATEFANVEFPAPGTVR